MYEKKLDQDDSYLESRLRPIGITPRLRSFPLNEHGATSWYFYPDSNGNIKIVFPAAGGGLQQFWRKIREGEGMEDITPTDVTRTRFKPGLEPIDKKTGKVKKYVTQRGCPSPLFIPFNLLRRIREGDPVETLFLTEGEFKAAAADRHGLPIVSVPGINNTGHKDEFLPQLQAVITSLNVQRLCFIYDSDLFDISASAEPGGNVAERPLNFLASAVWLARRADTFGLPAYIAWPDRPEDGSKRGLDDELLFRIGEAPPELNELEEQFGGAGWFHATPWFRKMARGLSWCTPVRLDTGRIGELPGFLAPPDPGPSVGTRDHSAAIAWLARGRREIRRIMRLPRGSGQRIDGWNCVEADQRHLPRLYDLWSLDSPQSFLDRHRERLADWESFVWKKERYLIVDGKAQAEGVVLQVSLQTQDGFTYRHNSEGVRTFLANFCISGKWRLEGVRKGHYILEVHDATGRRRQAIVDSETLASSQRFKVFMLKHLNLVWQGGDPELTALLQSSVVCADEAEVLLKVGWNAKLGAWVWANGIYIPQEAFRRMAEDGTLKVGDGHVILPAAPMLDNDGLFSEARKHPLRDTAKVTWQQWYHKSMMVWGTRRAAVAMAFVAAAVCQDIIRSKLYFFPLLFGFGPPGMGKTTFMRSIQAFFGIIPNRNELGITMEAGTTLPGLRNTLASVDQVPVFLDEMSDRTSPALFDLVKGTYNKQAPRHGSQSGDQSVVSFDLNASVLAASQHLPSADPATVERFLFIEFPQRDQADGSEVVRMLELQDLEREGLQHLVHQVIDQRHLVERLWNSAFQRIRLEIIEWARTMNIPVSDRVASNHAAIATPMAIMGRTLCPDFDEGLIVDAIQQLLPLQVEASASSDDVTMFWAIFQDMIEEKKIYMGQHYQVDREKGELYFNFRVIHIRYMEHVGKIRNMPGIKEATMKRYLKGSKAHLERPDHFQLRVNPNAGTTTVMVFDLGLLPLQLSF